MAISSKPNVVDLTPSIGIVNPGAFVLGSKVIAHSISEQNNEIITWEVAAPKWMVAEFNTHKVEIERNSASSRAVPISVIINTITEFPCMPHEWRYNTKGMEASELMSAEDTAYANKVWLDARDDAIRHMKRLQNLPSGRSADKQRANRIAEFCMGTIIVCTMTSGGKIGMNNFFGLRDNKAAQPEFGYIARMMHEQYHASVPTNAVWHLPYIDWNEVTSLGNGCWQLEDTIFTEFDELYLALCYRSSARCGRVTHYKQGQDYTLEEDIARGQSFEYNGHFSPLRHAAHAGVNQWYGNMYGWKQFSKLVLDDMDYVTKCCERAR